MTKTKVGRPKILTPCGLCHKLLGVHEMRLHLAACRKTKKAKKIVSQMAEAGK